ncbi:MAG: hypothetical protein ABI725_10150 [Chloroflexota bacterium]
MPKATWAAGEQINGEARLILTQGDAVDLGGSGGGLIAFSYAEVGGLDRHMDGIVTADCRPRRLTANAPFTSGLQGGGSYNPGEPNEDFYRAFMTAPYVALPEGTWDIAAVTMFSEGAYCSGTNFSFGTTVRVTITPK